MVTAPGTFSQVDNATSLCDFPIGMMQHLETLDGYIKVHGRLRKKTRGEIAVIRASVPLKKPGTCQSRQSDSERLCENRSQRQQIRSDQRDSVRERVAAFALSGRSVCRRITSLTPPCLQVSVYLHSGCHSEQVCAIVECDGRSSSEHTHTHTPLRPSSIMMPTSTGPASFYHQRVK